MKASLLMLLLLSGAPMAQAIEGTADISQEPEDLQEILPEGKGRNSCLGHGQACSFQNDKCCAECLRNEDGRYYCGG